MAEISDGDLDRLILDTIELERDQAPAPPAWASVLDRRHPAPRRVWMLVASAAMIATAVVAVSFAARPSSTTDSPAPSTADTPNSAAPTTSLGVATTASPTTTAPGSPTTPVVPVDVGFTPLLLDPVPDGFRLVWARYGAQGDDVYAMARYAGPETSPDIVLTTRNMAGFFDQLIQDGRRTWNISGRTVVVDGEGSGACLPDVCSVGTQWDDRTATSISWDGRTVPLDDSNTQDALAALVSNLRQVDGSYEPGVPDSSSYGWFFPDSSADLVVAGSLAGNPAVIVDDGQALTQRLDTAARAAFSTADGRVIIDSNDGPKLLDSTGLHDLWGNVSWTTPVRIQDVATIDGVPTALLTQPNEVGCDTYATCPVTIRISPIDNYEPRTIASNFEEFDISGRLSLTNDGTIAVFRVIDGAARLFIFSPNGISLAQQADPSARFLAVDPTKSVAAWTERDELVVQTIASGQIVRNALPYDLRTTDVAGLDITVDDHGSPVIAISTAGGDIIVIGANGEAHRTNNDLTGLAAFGPRPTTVSS